MYCSVRWAEQTFGDYYPALFSFGLSSEHLCLAVADESDTDCDIEISRVTNQVMLELLNSMNRNMKYSYYTYWQWASYLFKTAPRDSFPTIKSLRQSVVRL